MFCPTRRIACLGARVQGEGVVSKSTGDSGVTSVGGRCSKTEAVGHGPTASITAAILSLLTFWIPFLPLALGLASILLGAMGITARAKSQTILLLSMSGALCGFLAIMVAGISTYKLATAVPEVTEMAEGKGEDALTDEQEVEAENEPVAGVRAAAPAVEPAAESDPRRQLVKSIHQWNQMGKSYGLRGSAMSFKLKVTRVWLGDDLTSRPVDGGEGPQPSTAAESLPTEQDRSAVPDAAPDIDDDGRERIPIPGLHDDTGQSPTRDLGEQQGERELADHPGR